MILEYQGVKPQIDPSAFIAPSADLIGNIKIMENAGIWFNVVIRADIGKVVIGKNSNIQDLSMLHMDENGIVDIGENVTVGHSCTLHDCIIGDNSLIGMGATILSNVKIGKNCIIGAGSVVLENTVIPDNSLVAGLPAKIKRTLKEETGAELREHAMKYVELAHTYK